MSLTNRAKKPRRARFLSAGVIDIVDFSARTALMNEAASGHLEIVRDLLAYGAAVELVDREGKTALHWAAEHGFAEVVRVLLDAGASTEVCDRDGWNPLACAADGGNTRIVTALIEGGADVNARAHSSYPNMLEHGIRSNEGWTPLMFAAGRDQADAIRTLLGAGADPAIKNDMGETAEDVGFRQAAGEACAILRAVRERAILRRANGPVVGDQVEKPLAERRKL